MNEYQYILRAHHGMCISFFEGKGYSSEFTQHMAHIVQNLNENPLVKLSNQTDIVCQKCPNNHEGICETADKVASYDRQVLSHCGLTVGTILPFAQFQKMVQETIIAPGKRESICGDCQWNEICRKK